jgi:hypothetical protein
MAKKGFLKTAAFLSLFVGLAAGVSAQTTISGGFALSSMKVVYEEPGYTEEFDGKVGAGFNFYIDRLLPISIPLSLGGEIGFDTASASQDNRYYDTMEVQGYVIPILLRVAYHFDLMPKLDLYLVGKIGGAFGFSKIDYGDGDGEESESGYGGFGFGFDVGVAYYFVPRFGLFVEGGFDRYNLKKDFNETWYSYTIKAPFNRFFTVGISTKF